MGKKLSTKQKHTQILKMAKPNLGKKLPKIVMGLAPFAQIAKPRTQKSLKARSAKKIKCL